MTARKTAAARPALDRKHTRATETKAHAELDEGVAISVDGREYRVTAGDLNALDSRALRRAIGVGFPGLMQQLGSDPDLDSIAAVVWLARRVEGEAHLEYDDVAAEFTYNDVIKTEFLTDPPAGGDDDPEG
jgi:hypothetical protein